MTTIDTPPSPALLAGTTAKHHGIPLSRIVTTELRKMLDTRSGFWLTASIGILALLATAAVILFAPHNELTYNTFVAAIGIPMTLVLPMFAILSVTGEWSQRSGLTTFTLVPHRGRVIAAKAISCVGVAVVTIPLAFGIGALGNVAGTAIAGVDPNGINFRSVGVRARRGSWFWGSVLACLRVSWCGSGPRDVSGLGRRRVAGEEGRGGAGG